MIAVNDWTGEEALLLQAAMRLSVREFARRLGIAPRTVTNWGQNPHIKCRPATQQILDAALGQCTSQEQSAFRLRLAELRRLPAASAAALISPHVQVGPATLTSHKFLPVFAGTALGSVVGDGAVRVPGPGGLERICRAGPRASTVHLYACGVAVLHLTEELQVESFTELAQWRYRSYGSDRAWAGGCLARLLETSAGAAELLAPPYVLSAYELHDHGLAEETVVTALHLLATPSVLVDRSDPDNVVPLQRGVEEARLAEGWRHPEAVEFSGGLSLGVASWSGVAYHPRQRESALTMQDIVALELDVQALWALSSHILATIEDGRDPVMPADYSWRYLRGAYSRLTTARPTETAQHRAMREAILSTSDLPERLRAAQDALRDAA